MSLALMVDLAMSVVAYALTDRLIGSAMMRDMFIKAGLSGKDLNKTSDARVYVIPFNAHHVYLPCALPPDPRAWGCCLAPCFSSPCSCSSPFPSSRL